MLKSYYYSQHVLRNSEMALKLTTHSKWHGHRANSHRTYYNPAAPCACALVVLFPWTLVGRSPCALAWPFLWALVVPFARAFHHGDSLWALVGPFPCALCKGWSPPLGPCCALPLGHSHGLTPALGPLIGLDLWPFARVDPFPCLALTLGPCRTLPLGLSPWLIPPHGRLLGPSLGPFARVCPFLWALVGPFPWAIQNGWSLVILWGARRHW